MAPPIRKRSRSQEDDSSRRPWKTESPYYKHPKHSRDGMTRQYDNGRYDRHAGTSTSRNRAAEEYTPASDKNKSNTFQPAGPKKPRDVRGQIDFSDEVLVRKKEADEENQSLKEELKVKRKEMEWKCEELAEKRKEILTLQKEVGNLKNKKEKQGTLDVNAGLNKKNAAPKEEKKSLNDTQKDLKSKIKDLESEASLIKFKLKEVEVKKEKYRKEKNDAFDEIMKANKSITRLRGERDKAKDDLIKNISANKENVKRHEEGFKKSKDGLRKNIADLEFKLAKLSINKTASDGSDAATVESDDDVREELEDKVNEDEADEIDEPKDEENEIVPSPTLPLDTSPELRPLDTSKEEDTPVVTRGKKNQVKRGSKRKLLPSIGDENDLANLDFDGDNSFDIIPTSSRRRGRKLVTNFNNLKPKNKTLKKTKAMRYSNRNFAVTILNEQVSFIAISEERKSTHDVDTFGVRPCGLYPACSNLLRGGEDISKVFIISPEHHKNYEAEAWACMYHAEASIKGEEIQTQVTKPEDDDAETPAKKEVATKVPVPPAPTKSKPKTGGGASKADPDSSDEK